VVVGDEDVDLALLLEVDALLHHAEIVAEVELA